MTFNAFWPLIEFSLFFLLRWMARFWNRRLTCSRYVSNSKSIQDYIDLYCGPVYSIHYKYSYVLNVVFITFMFGAGLPILFPIALLSFIILNLVESLGLAFSYRKPPMFDASLNIVALNIMTLAPLLYCSVGFWMYDNIQLFSNRVVFYDSYVEDIKTGHNISTMFSKESIFNIPLVIVLVLQIILLLTRRWWIRLSMKNFTTQEIYEEYDLF